MPPLLAAASLFAAASPALAETRPVDATIELSCSEPFNDGIKGLSIRVTGEVPTQTRQGENVGIANAAVELLLGPAGSGDGPDELAVETFGFYPQLEGARQFPRPAVVLVDSATAPRVPGTAQPRWRASLPWTTSGQPQPLGQTTGTADVVIGAPSFSLTAFADSTQAGNTAEDLERAQRCVPVPGQQPLATIENVSPVVSTTPFEQTVQLRCDPLITTAPLSVRLRGQVPATVRPGSPVRITDLDVRVTAGTTFTQLPVPGPAPEIVLDSSVEALTFTTSNTTPAQLIVPGLPVRVPPVPETTGTSQAKYEVQLPNIPATSDAVTLGSGPVAVRFGSLSFRSAVRLATSPAGPLGEIVTCAATVDPGPLATVPGSADTQAPSVPKDLKVGRSADNTSAQLTWSPSTDNVGVVSYEVVSAGRPTVITKEPKATVTGLSNEPYTVSVRARDAAGNVSALSGSVTSYAVACGGCGSYDYDVAGTATVKTLTKGTLPLRGRTDFDSISLTTGLISADLSLEPTTARLTALGFIPVTAKVAFVTSSKTTGKLDDTGLALKTLVRIKLPEVKLFGTVPLAGGTTCQTRSLSTIDLKGPGFRLPDGGTLTGTFAISDLSGCGVLNGLVSPLTAGSGNTIKLALKPRA